MRPPSSRLSPARLVQVELIADWKATPHPEREHSSLAALARANNWPIGPRLYDLANSTEVYHRMLTKVAGDALDEAPAVLRTLADKAKEGNVRAAQVYLDFVRQTITDEGLMQRIKPAAEVRDVLHQTALAAQSLLELAAVLGDDPELARLRMARMVEEEKEPPCDTSPLRSEDN